MSREELRKALDTLNSEIDRIESTDLTVKQSLTQLIAQVERELDGEGASEASEPLARESIPGLIEQFEMEHPRITETLNRIMVTLGNMGI